MINYIQQLLPRIREYNSRLDKRELFVDKLFTLLQPNNKVHQYTFNRDGRLFLAIDGVTTEGKWELLATGQLLINRGKNDIITLDFDFLHPDILIMKLGGTIDNPFIIYRSDIIKDGNVLNFLKKFDANNKGEKIYELPNLIIYESELDDLILDENGKPFNGELTSPAEALRYSLSVKHIYVVKNGEIKAELFEVSYPYGFNDQIVVRQVDKDEININDEIVISKSFLKSEKPNSQVTFADKVFQFNEEFGITAIKNDFSGNVLIFVGGAIMAICIFLIILAKIPSSSSTSLDSAIIDSVSVEVMPDTSFDSVDTTITRAAADSMAY
jgi:hypothetical protein